VCERSVRKFIQKRRIQHTLRLPTAALLSNLHKLHEGFASKRFFVYTRTIDKMCWYANLGMSNESMLLEAKTAGGRNAIEWQKQCIENEHINRVPC
jgi:hypothetical protein